MVRVRARVWACRVGVGVSVSAGVRVRDLIVYFIDRAAQLLPNVLSMIRVHLQVWSEWLAPGRRGCHRQRRPRAEVAPTRSTNGGVGGLRFQL